MSPSSVSRATVSARFLLLLGLAHPACRLAPGSREPAPSGAVVERQLTAMGTWFSLEVHAQSRAQALAASELAVGALERTEERLSTWRADSELARLNRTPVGEPCPLSAELARDLERAAFFWRETGGAFDPGLGALIEAWGLRTGGRRPTSAELELARAAGGFSSFELAGQSAIRHHPAALIEEGGFGKGIGLDAALHALQASKATSAVLDLGGQLAILGAARVAHGLADPRDRERAVLELLLDGGSLATSGNSERGIVLDGKRLGHILDPRTGAPAPDFGSLSVWALDATAADCLSTGLYALGPEEALAWAALHDEVQVLVLEVEGEHLKALASDGWRGRLLPLVPELEIQFSPPRSAPSRI